MNTIITDKCILFLFSLLSLLFMELNVPFVIACLIAIAVSALNYVIPDSCFPLGTSLIYLASAFFIPEFCSFLPLVFYDFFSASFSPCKKFPKKAEAAAQFFFSILSAAALYRSCGRNFLFLFPAFGCVLSSLLQTRTKNQAALYHRYQQTRDDDTEIQILLEERNRSLQEKQNSEIYTATLRERNRIAREIHDNVGHMLTRSILMVGALRAIHRQDRALSESLAQLDDTLNQAMNSIRQSVHDLHDSSVNLKESLETMIREFTFCPVTLRYDLSPEVPREVKYSFIAIAREALVNISRHSNASAASITAVEHPGFYQYIIEDNGTGTFSEGTKNPRESVSQGIGLSNIQSRVKSLNGNIQIQNQQGFRIYITVPKEAAN